MLFGGEIPHRAILKMERRVNRSKRKIRKKKFI